MAERLSIQIKDEDNVVVAVHDFPPERHWKAAW